MYIYNSHLQNKVNKVKQKKKIMKTVSNKKWVKPEVVLTI